MNLLDYKDQTLYLMEIPCFNRTWDFLFQRIPFGEFKRIKYAERFLSVQKEELEEQIFQEYILPKNKYDEYQLERMPAGLITTVVDVIMFLSDSYTIPDKNGDVDLESFQTRMHLQRLVVGTSLEVQIFSTICSVFRGYKFDDLEKLSFDRIHQLFAAAERHLLTTGQIYEPFDFNIVKPGQPTEPNPPASPSRKPSPIQSVDDEDDAMDSLMEEIKKNAREENIIKTATVQIKPEPKAETKSYTRPESVRPIVNKDPDNMEELYESGFLIRPIQVDKNHPFYEKLQKKENERVSIVNKARLENRSQSTGYTKPADTYAETKAGNIQVPGISHTSKFSEKDFTDPNIPIMTEEEAESLLAPAGFEIIQARKASQIIDKNKEIKEIVEKKYGNKKLTIQQMARMRDDINKMKK